MTQKHKILVRQVTASDLRFRSQRVIWAHDQQKWLRKKRFYGDTRILDRLWYHS